MGCPICVIGGQRGLGETGRRSGRGAGSLGFGHAPNLCREHLNTDAKDAPMLFPSRTVNCDNRDYRAYCDHRTRQKRRLRLRMSIGLALALMAGMVLVAARFSTVAVW